MEAEAETFHEKHTPRFEVCGHQTDKRGRNAEVVLQCVAACCSVLQCVAVCCSVLQCVAGCCLC